MLPYYSDKKNTNLEEEYIIPLATRYNEYNKLKIDDDISLFFWERLFVYIDNETNKIQDDTNLYKDKINKKINEVKNVFIDDSLYLNFLEFEKQKYPEIVKEQNKDKSKILLDFQNKLNALLQPYIRKNAYNVINESRFTTYTGINDVFREKWYLLTDQGGEVKQLVDYIKDRCQSGFVNVFYDVKDDELANSNPDNIDIIKKFKELFIIYVRNYYTVVNSANVCIILNDMDNNKKKITLDKIIEDIIVNESHFILKDVFESFKKQNEIEKQRVIEDILEFNKYISKININVNYGQFLSKVKIDFYLNDTLVTKEERINKITNNLSEYINFIDESELIKEINKLKEDLDNSKELNENNYTKTIKLIAKIYDFKYNNIEDFDKGNVIINLKINFKNEESRTINNNGIIYEILSDKNRLSQMDASNMNYIRKYVRNVTLYKEEIKNMQNYICSNIQNNLLLFNSEIKNFIENNERYNTIKNEDIPEYYTKGDNFIVNISARLNVKDIELDFGIEEISKILNDNQMLNTPWGLSKQQYEKIKPDLKVSKNKIFNMIKFLINFTAYKILPENNKYSTFIESFLPSKNSVEDISDELMFAVCSQISMTNNMLINPKLQLTGSKILDLYKVIEEFLKMYLTFDVELIAKELSKNMKIEDFIVIHNKDVNVEGEILNELNIDSNKYYNKTIIPNTNDLYKITKYENTDLFEYIEIIPLPVGQFKNTDLEILKKIKGEEDFKEELNKPFYIQNNTDIDKYNEYLKKSMERVKLIIEYISNNKKNSKFILNVTNNFKKIFQILEHSQKLINNKTAQKYIITLILLDLIEIFLSVGTELVYSGNVSLSDLHRIELLPLKISEYTEMYNNAQDKPENKVESINETIDKMNVKLLNKYRIHHY